MSESHISPPPNLPESLPFKAIPWIANLLHPMHPPGTVSIKSSKFQFEMRANRRHSKQESKASKKLSKFTLTRTHTYETNVGKFNSVQKSITEEFAKPAGRSAGHRSGDNCLPRGLYLSSVCVAMLRTNRSTATTDPVSGFSPRAPSHTTPFVRPVFVQTGRWIRKLSSVRRNRRKNRADREELNYWPVWDQAPACYHWLPVTPCPHHSHGPFSHFQPDRVGNKRGLHSHQVRWRQLGSVVHYIVWLIRR